MKGFFNLWLIIALYLNLLVLYPRYAEATPLREAQLIRRVYLDVLGIPPSPKELDWYLSYNNNSYETAVKWVVKQPGAYYNSLEDTEMINHLCSPEYRNKPQIKIIPFQLELIVKYQCGNMSLSIDDADIKLTASAIGVGEGNVLDTIDYISECLTGRLTYTEEANSLLQVYKKYPSESEGYLAVLKEIKTFKDFLYK
jgi:hypothetical protein